MKPSKRLKYWLAMILLLMFMFLCKDTGKLKAATKIEPGENVTESIGNSGKTYYMKLPHKMKVEIKVGFWSQEEYEDNYFMCSLYRKGEEDNYIEECFLDNGESKTFTHTYAAGTYILELDSEYGAGDTFGLDVSDVSIYASKITMAKSTSILEGASKLFTVKPEESGELLGTVTWSSSNEKVATVQASGRVTAVKAGSCLISAKTEKANTIQCKVTVVPKYATKISATKSLSLYERTSKKITVKRVSGGKKLNTITWSTTNKKVAKVDKNGKVTGVGAGSCKIKVKMKGGNTVFCKVTVKARPKLYIRTASFDINFLDGVEPYIYVENNYKKTIKYIYFETYYYNQVNDPAYCSIGHNYSQVLTAVGPIKPKKTGVYEWDPIIYNETTYRMYIKRALVVFMDGTSKKVTIRKSYY